ncbi:hypothetical protein RIF29_30677 [Crotalaria pallida]|uniref:Uncharacterized protein n=1 Tax=Crotalaria pallida TaxID=3830 RepID=A0AAN9EIS3_CROPI
MTGLFLVMEKDLKKKEKELQAKKAELRRREQSLPFSFTKSLKKENNQSDDFKVQADGLSAAATNNLDATPTLDKEDGFNNLHDLESSLASFPIKPLQALKYGYSLSVFFFRFFSLSFQVMGSLGHDIIGVLAKYKRLF